MSKKQLLLLTCVSTIALAGTTAFAEDVVPVDPAVPSTEVVTPPNPVEPSLPTDTTDPSTPVVPEKLPDTSKPAEPETPKEELPAPMGPTTPSAGKEDKPDKPETVPGQAETPKEEIKPEKPKSSEDKKKEELVPDNVSKDIIDKVDKETGNITIKPIQLSPDKTIVGTQNGNVIIRDSSGSHLVSASEVGGRLNEDGTVTIKDSSGKTKTLPRTGEAKGFLSIIGATILSFVAYLFKQRVTLN